MEWYDVLTLFLGIFAALQMDRLSHHLVNWWFRQARPSCAMCGDMAEVKFSSDPEKALIDLCPRCMDEAMKGAAKQAMMAAAEELRGDDDYDSQTDF